MSWWGGLLIGAGLLVASWMLLVFLAARLPEGSLKELAAFLPDCATTARRLRGDDRVPRRAKIAVGFALLWVLSPIDLIPEFLPVIGPLDDVVVVALAFRYAARQVPPRCCSRRGRANRPLSNGSSVQHAPATPTRPALLPRTTWLTRRQRQLLRTRTPCGATAADGRQCRR